MSDKPELSVRAFAEMIMLPAYEQQRILYEQKHPRIEPTVFRVPFYTPALGAIRKYYRSGNDPIVLARALAEFQESIRLKQRLNHNQRVVRAFQGGQQARRRIGPQSHPRIRTVIEGVVLRLNFDLVGEEDDSLHYIFYNCRAAPLEPEIARLTAEIAHWCIERSSITIPLRLIEYVDLHSQAIHTFPRRRTRAVRLALQNARIVRQLWSGI